MDCHGGTVAKAFAFGAVGGGYSLLAWPIANASYRLVAPSNSEYALLTDLLVTDSNWNSQRLHGPWQPPRPQHGPQGLCLHWNYSTTMEWRNIPNNLVRKVWIYYITRIETKKIKWWTFLTWFSMKFTTNRRIGFVYFNSFLFILNHFYLMLFQFISIYL